MSTADEDFNQAITEFNLGNYKKALALFERVLLADPSHVNALIKKGNILGKFGKYYDAIKSYDIVLKTEPENVLALINKGLALHYLEDYDSAVSCYNKILQKKPNSAITLYNMASSLIREGKIDDGLVALQKSISLDYSFKYKARFDIDFAHIQKNSNFKRMIL